MILKRILRKMRNVIGIDVGGSTTKIVGFDENKDLIAPMFVHANDQVTSIYGAFGKFIDENGLSLDDIAGIKMTGVGATFIEKGIYGLKCDHVSEFKSIGMGGLYLSGLDRALVASLGTGSACVYAEKGKSPKYLGGTGVGGGTLMGLSKLLLGMDNIKHIYELADEGDLSRIDLRIKNITKKEELSELSSELTVANFGKLSDLASKSDIALGIMNMVFETVGTIAVFAARTHDVKDIVLTGNLTTVPQAAQVFKNVGDLLGANFIIPQYAQYGTVIGAALQGIENK